MQSLTKHNQFNKTKQNSKKLEKEKRKKKGN